MIPKYLFSLLSFPFLDHINQTRGESSDLTKDINNSYKSNSFAVHYQPTSIPSISISDETKSDESEVTITRL